MRLNYKFLCLTSIVLLMPSHLFGAELHIVDYKRSIAQYLSQGNEGSEIASALKQKETAMLTLAAFKREQLASPWLEHMDQVIRNRKGIARKTDSIIRFRRVGPAIQHEHINSASLLFSYAPAGDEQSWSRIEAFDQTGSRVYLDAHRQPTRPVIVVELDKAKDMKLGLELMNRAFGQAHDLSAMAGGINTSVLKRIRLNDDQEPWILGDAEVFALSNGIDNNADRVKLQALDLPYLDTEDRQYYPNQILLFWDNYRFQAADIVLMEHDDGTNYAELAALLLAIAQEALESAGQVELATIAQVTGQIIDRLPDSWLTNDHDFLDAFYTLRMGQNYYNRFGAAANANVDIEHLFIPEVD